jgi:hypothetical protein
MMRRSDVWSYINQRNEIMFPEDTHIVGDKAYPCLPQLITQFRNNGHLNANERNFDYRLSVVRSCIERAFALLKKRCRCLKDNLDVRCIDWLCKYIMACCVIHNICILQNDVLDLNAEDIENENGEEFNEDIIMERDRLRMGQQKRNYICNNLLQ